jgi:MOSC domain-containing protein YiiM
MRSMHEAVLVAGEGIIGDRYYLGAGKFSRAAQDQAHEVTLVEAEHVQRFNATYGMALDPGDLRRNLVTTGVDLNALVGVEFTIGDVVLKGIRLCEPCDYLAGLTHKNVLTGLVHRAGLRAGILKGGVVSVETPSAIRGDRIRSADDSNQHPVSEAV